MSTVILDISDNIVIKESGVENPSNSGFKFVDDDDYVCEGWEEVVRVKTNNSNRSIELSPVAEDETKQILIFHQKDGNKKLYITLPEDYSFHTGTTSVFINSDQGGARFTYVGNNEYYIEHKA